MNDGMLSQEEINQLLAGISSDDDDLQDSSDDNDEALLTSEHISDIEKDTLGEIGNISFGSAATALSTLLNQKVDITTPVVSVIKREMLEKEFPQPNVAIHVEYTQGFEGINVLVIQTKDAAIIADLMMGGDGTNPATDMDEMQISAVQEAMNQMMGSASTSMSTIFNKKVDISPPGIDLMDAKNSKGTKNIPADDILVKISFRLKIGELIDSSIMQIVTVKFAKNLVNELMNPGGEETTKNETTFQTQMETPKQNNAQSVKQEQAPTEQPVPVSYQEPIPHQQQEYENRGQQHIGGYGQRSIEIQPAAFSSFESPRLTSDESRNLNMLLDIPLQVTVELGRTKRSIKEILEFSQGSIIELDKLAGEPVDILVNQKLIAKGEVVVIDENFGVRVTDIVSTEERLKNLR